MFVYRSPEPSQLPAAERPQRRITLGIYPALSLAGARMKAKGYQGEVANGIDPQGPHGAANPQLSVRGKEETSGDTRLKCVLGNLSPVAGTFAHLAAEYLLRHAWFSKKRTRDDESMLRRDLLPRWGMRSAAQIRKGDVIALIDLIIARGAPIAARATKALISKIFNFGISRDLVEHNPTVGVKTPTSKSREVWLRAHEIRMLWTELDGRPLITSSVFRVILLTLQRPGEVCAMEWTEVKGDWWEIPGIKTKNSRTHRVFLSPQVQAILALLHPLTGGSRYVFESQKRRMQATTWINKAGYSICKVTGLSFTPHDLRRTGATHLGEMGISDEVIDAVLNHTCGGVVKVYNRYTYDAEKRAALAAWGKRVADVIRPNPNSRID